MFVKFTTNVGSNDLKPLGLDVTQCTEGATLEVLDELGERLLQRRFAVPVEIEGIAKKSGIGKTKPFIKES